MLIVRPYGKPLNSRNNPRLITLNIIRRILTKPESAEGVDVP